MTRLVRFSCMTLLLADAVIYTRMDSPWAGLAWLALAIAVYRFMPAEVD